MSVLGVTKSYLTIILEFFDKVEILSSSIKLGTARTSQTLISRISSISCFLVAIIFSNSIMAIKVSIIQ